MEYFLGALFGLVLQQAQFVGPPPYLLAAALARPQGNRHQHAAP
jgi:hypothetical protein